LQRLHHRAEHSADLIAKSFSRLKEWLGAEAQRAGYHELSLNLGDRATRVSKKLDVLTFGRTPISFRDVAGYGDRSSAKLIRKAKSLCIGKGRGQFVDGQGQFNSTLPNG
jgi:hypothetical protein